MVDLSKYLTGEIKSYLFSELDSGFLVSNDLTILETVPIPIRQDDLKEFTRNGLSTTAIADNMAMVIGADDNFKYKEKYLAFLKKLFDEKLVSILCQKSEDLLKNHSYRKALCYVKAALLLNPLGKEPMYCYANACRIWYQSMEGENEVELISLLKSDANEYFAMVTSNYPDFAPAWYFLGYAYLNAGAYTKAFLAFTHYLEVSAGQAEEDIKEVKERIESLKDPMELEKGQNYLLAGRYEDALKILEPYVNTEYVKWWPLHFYLATAYDNLGYIDESIEGFENVLKYCPSNYDACVSLAKLYNEIGNEEKAIKYSKKADIILGNSNDNN